MSRTDRFIDKIMRNFTKPTSNFEGLPFLPNLCTRYDYEDVFRALLLGVEEAVARTRKNWRAASTDMAQYRQGPETCRMGCVT